MHLSTLRLLQTFSAGVALALLAACASAPEQTATAQKPVTCEREYKVGSNIPVRDCAPKQSDADHQQTVDTLRDAIKPPIKVRSAAGG